MVVPCASKKRMRVTLMDAFSLKFLNVQLELWMLL